MVFVHFTRINRRFIPFICAFLFSALWLAQAQAKEILYIGSFAPFHRTHLAEILGAANVYPEGTFKILPVESAYYNSPESLPRPRFFPYELDVELIRKSSAILPGVQVSTRLRHIDHDVLDEILAVARESRDPDVSVLIGTDILEIWSNLPGFRKFSSSVKLLVNHDPKAPELTKRLKARLANNPNVEFVSFDSPGIRGTEIKKAVLWDSEKLKELLPEPSYDFLSRSHGLLEKLKDDYLLELRSYNRRLVKEKLLPILRENGVAPGVIKAIDKNPDLQDSLVFTSFDDAASLIRLSNHIDAKRGVSAYLRTEQEIEAWIASFDGISSRPIDSQFRYTRSLGLTVIDYTYGLGLKAPLKPRAKRRPPEFLFHWTTHTKMQRMVDYNVYPDQVPLRFIGAQQFLTRQYPKLAGRSAIYAWSNPVLGMIASSSEIYARSEKGLPARLLAMKVRPGAIVAEIHTDLDSERKKKSSGLDSADLIYHEAYRGGKILYREWVVLNPAAIESYTADPDEARPLLLQELEHLRDPRFRYPESEKLFPGNRVERKQLIEILENYLAGGKAGIPPELVKPFPAGSTARHCGALLTEPHWR